MFEEERREFENLSNRGQKGRERGSRGRSNGRLKGMDGWKG